MTAEFEAACALWSGKLAAAKVQYELAKLAMAGCASETMPRADGSFAYGRALKAETEALTEYKRVLRLFHRLTVHGEMPPQETSQVTALPSRPAGTGGETEKEDPRGQQ